MLVHSAPLVGSRGCVSVRRPWPLHQVSSAVIAVTGVSSTSGWRSGLNGRVKVLDLLVDLGLSVSAVTVVVGLTQVITAVVR